MQALIQLTLVADMERDTNMVLLRTSLSMSKDLRQMCSQFFLEVMILLEITDPSDPINYTINIHGMTEYSSLIKILYLSMILENQPLEYPQSKRP